jgi:signal transduction histidine kinase
MAFFSRPRTLKSELQILFIVVGSAFLSLATILLYQNGQAALRRRLLSTATTAAETAASLVGTNDHRFIRDAGDMNSTAYREIAIDLAALRRANTDIIHLYTLSPVGRLGDWGVVVDMGGSEPYADVGPLVRGRLPIGSPPPPTLPPDLIQSGMTVTAARIVKAAAGDPPRAVAVAPIRTQGGASVGLAIVELSAAELIAEARLLGYVSIGIFLVGLGLSVIASTFVSRWVTRPIEDLLRGVDEIAHGNLRARVAHQSTNELGSLAAAFNHMVESLEASKSRNEEQQARLRHLHRLGSQVAGSLELPEILQLASAGLREICGGEEAVAGTMGPRDPAIRLWARSGQGTADLSKWTAEPEALDRVLAGEARLLARTEFDAAGLGCLHSRPGDYALAAPMRWSDKTIGVLVALGGRSQFHSEAVSVASLFVSQVAAAVGNARLFEQVRALDRSKSEFLSIASHEVRTPLTVMKSSLDILVTSGQFEYSSDQRQLIAFCQESVERLIRLVKDILDVSKIEAGVLSVHFLPTSLNELIEKCLFWVPQLPGGQGIEVDARLPSEPAMVYADAGRITQVLENLISNAIKFSKPGGKVSIELKAHPREYEVIVTDQGKGIAPEHLERIFGKFYQVEDSATRERGGTGLGLAICKGIIDAHRGRIWAESALGDGSRFHFSLARVVDKPFDGSTDAHISVNSVLSSLRSERPKAA